MMIYFSKTTRGFYRSEVHGTAIPSDSVEIAEELWAAMLEGQQQGMLIGADDSGLPVLQDPPPAVVPVPREISKAAAKIILARNGLLAPLLAYINGLPDTDEDKIIFLDMATWTRDSPTLIRLARGVLGLTDQQLDEFFIAADQLTI